MTTISGHILLKPRISTNQLLGSRGLVLHILVCRIPTFILLSYCKQWEISRILQWGTLVPIFRPYFGGISPYIGLKIGLFSTVGTSKFYRFQFVMAIDSMAWYVPCSSCQPLDWSALHIPSVTLHFYPWAKTNYG